jgi:hypothetical protein
MALPKLNNTPYYDVVIPSTGEKTKYRPYLVKEEKVLLIASESSDTQTMSEAMLDIVCTCVEAANRNKLTTFDIDYLFVKLRTKAVGETSDILLTCTADDCGEQNDVKINLSDIVVVIPEDKKNIIQLQDEMTLQLKYPTYYSMINDQVIKHAESSAEIMYSTVMLCLDTLHVKDELMKFADEPVEDIVEFIGSLTPDQFSKLSEFANSVPEVTHNANFVCTKCNQKNEQLLEGTNSFFL